MFAHPEDDHVCRVQILSVRADPAVPHLATLPLKHLIQTNLEVHIQIAKDTSFPFLGWIPPQLATPPQTRMVSGWDELMHG